MAKSVVRASPSAKTGVRLPPKTKSTAVDLWPEGQYCGGGDVQALAHHHCWFDSFKDWPLGDASVKGLINGGRGGNLTIGLEGLGEK